MERWEGRKIKLLMTVFTKDSYHNAGKPFVCRLRERKTEQGTVRRGKVQAARKKKAHIDISATISHFRWKEGKARNGKRRGRGRQGKLLRRLFAGDKVKNH